MKPEPTATSTAPFTAAIFVGVEDMVVVEVPS
jgi:hypothetical protein